MGLNGRRCMPASNQRAHIFIRSIASRRRAGLCASGRPTAADAACGGDGPAGARWRPAGDGLYRELQVIRKGRSSSNFFAMRERHGLSVCRQQRCAASRGHRRTQHASQCAATIDCFHEPSPLPFFFQFPASHLRCRQISSILLPLPPAVRLGFLREGSSAAFRPG
jgi:hypothetical protein